MHTVIYQTFPNHDHSPLTTTPASAETTSSRNADTARARSQVERVMGLLKVKDGGRGRGCIHATAAGRHMQHGEAVSCLAFQDEIDCNGYI